MANATQEILNHDPLGLQKLNENFIFLNEAVNTIASGVNFRGTFDPTTGLDENGVAIPTPSEDNRGFEWAASVAGSYTPPGNTTPLTFAINDRLISNGVNYDLLTETNADATARSMAQEALTSLDNKVDAVNAKLTGTATLNGVTLATTAPPTVYSIAPLLQNGFHGRDNESYYYKDQFGRVFVAFNIVNDSTVIGGEVLFTLPVDFRPLIAVELIASINVGIPCLISIDSSGQVRAQYPSPSYESAVLIFQGEFLTA